MNHKRKRPKHRCRPGRLLYKSACRICNAKRAQGNREALVHEQRAA